MRVAMTVLLLLWAVWSLAAPPEITDETDQEILGAFLSNVEKLAAYCTPERMAKFASQPEDITWQASKHIEITLVAYRLTEEAKYLDMFVKRMDTLCDELREGPDGFLGWYGLPYPLFRHPDHPRRTTDVIITSFKMAELAAEFARTVRADEALAEEYGEAADRYLKLAEDHLVKKWDARGNYKDLGKTGAVYITPLGLKPTKGHLTEPHNKHSKIIRALLSLCAATGKEEYLVKAIKLGTRFKHCLTLVDDRYVWNYWDPSGAWDIHPDDAGKWKHWIGSEHRGGYYNLSLSQAVIMYEHGLVFDRTDIERFLKTQTEVCWNGDFENPKWFKVDGKPADPKYQYLCGWLAPFDERVYRMAYGEPAQHTRYDNRKHSWQGGAVAMEWLEFKYLRYSRWTHGEPAEAEVVAPFLAKPEGRALVEELAFEVEAPGYQAPRSPGQMKDMPGKAQ